MTKPSTKRYTPRLSKSRYVSGKQCHLRLWNECFARQLATPVDEALQAIFDVGHRVGQFATRRYPGGEMIDEDHFHFQEASEHTKRAMSGGAPALFEAALEHQGVMCRVDVLVRAPDGAWDMVEVKSTGSAKEPHVVDLALQVWIARGAGLSIRRAGVLTLNTKYLYLGGDHDLQALFRLHDKSDEVASRAAAIAPQIEELKLVLGSEEAPRIAPGPHCHKPYSCQFFEHCTRDITSPENPLAELPSFRKPAIADWAEQGVSDILDLPEDAGLNPLQERVRQTLRSGEVFRGRGLGAALREPSYPIHHLDFETFMPAIPRYKNTRPFQTLPFQWSNHIQHQDGRLDHQEFLCESDVDPRRQCAQTLLASLGSEGSIVIYSPYETRVIRDLMRVLPEYRAALQALLPRCWDLHPVIKEHFYHPGFRGSFSLKSVLPTLVPSMSYEQMEIGDGGAAQAEYLKMIEAEDPAGRARIRHALLEYCGQDTLAMVKLRETLAEEAQSG